MTRPARADMPYRACVGIVVFNREGKVWAGRRLSKDLTLTEFRWQLPQGGIDEGEDPLNAARRELFEETGIKSVSLLSEAPGWFNYDLPDDILGVALKGKYRGQTLKWFAFRFEGDEGEINITEPPDGSHPEFDAWEWKSLDEMPELIVPFKRGVYQEVVTTFSEFSAS